MKLLPFLALASAAFSLPSPAPSPLDKRIISGEYAPNGAYPYIVSMFIGDKKGMSMCGGSIISDTLIVTAAHCFVNATTGYVNTASEIAIGFGHNSQSKQTFGKAESLHIHPYFNLDLGYINDIAIVKVPKIPLDGKNIRAIDIFKGKLSTGTPLIALGWGKISTALDSNDTSEYLKRTVIKIGRNNDCKENIPYFDTSDGPQICTQNSLTPKTDTCQGDSGTGVVVEVNGTPFLAGLVSYGYGYDARGEIDKTCALSNGYGIYTRVDQYMDFIGSVASLERCSYA